MKILTNSSRIYMFFTQRHSLKNITWWFIVNKATWCLKAKTDFNKLQDLKSKKKFRWMQVKVFYCNNTNIVMYKNFLMLMNRFSYLIKNINITTQRLELHQTCKNLQGIICQFVILQNFIIIVWWINPD